MIPDNIMAVKLWYHENMRVFYDRLTTEKDRNYFKDCCANLFKNFNLKEEEVLDCERIVFGDFMGGREAEPRFYRQISDLENLV